MAKEDIENSRDFEKVVKAIKEQMLGLAQDSPNFIGDMNYVVQKLEIIQSEDIPLDQKIDRVVGLLGAAAQEQRMRGESKDSQNVRMMNEVIKDNLPKLEQIIDRITMQTKTLNQIADECIQAIVAKVKNKEFLNDLYKHEEAVVKDLDPIERCKVFKNFIDFQMKSLNAKPDGVDPNDFAARIRIFKSHSEMLGKAIDLMTKKAKQEGIDPMAEQAKQNDTGLLAEQAKQKDKKSSSFKNSFTTFANKVGAKWDAVFHRDETPKQRFSQKK